MSRLTEVIGRVLDIPPEQITDSTSTNSAESWDSYNGLMLVSALEQEFKVSFTMDEVVAVKNVADIRAALRRHGVEGV